MVCRNQNCKAEFCWVCLGPWEPHGSAWCLFIHLSSLCITMVTIYFKRSDWEVEICKPLWCLLDFSGTTAIVTMKMTQRQLEMLKRWDTILLDSLLHTFDNVVTLQCSWASMHRKKNHLHSLISNQSPRFCLFSCFTTYPYLLLYTLSYICN